MFQLFGYEACGILALQPGMKSVHCAWKAKS